jgi:hypothetical protein
MADVAALEDAEVRRGRLQRGCVRSVRIAAMFDPELVHLPGGRHRLRALLEAVASSGGADAATAAGLSCAQLLRLAKWHPTLDNFAQLWSWHTGAEQGERPVAPPAAAFEQLLQIKTGAGSADWTDAGSEDLPDAGSEDSTDAGSEDSTDAGSADRYEPRKVPKPTCDLPGAGRLLDALVSSTRNWKDERIALIIWWRAAYAAAAAAEYSAYPQAGQ